MQETKTYRIIRPLARRRRERRILRTSGNLGVLATVRRVRDRMRLGGRHNAIELHSVAILARVGSLVAHGLDQAVDGGGDGRTERGSDEVDPKLRNEVAIDDGGSKGPSWVHRGAGDVDAYWEVKQNDISKLEKEGRHKYRCLGRFRTTHTNEMDDEDSHSNRPRSHKRHTALLHRQEQNYHHQLKGQEGLHCQSDTNPNTRTGRVLGLERTGKKTRHKGCRRQASKKLHGDDANKPHPVEGTDEPQAKGNLEKNGNCVSDKKKNSYHTNQEFPPPPPRYGCLPSTTTTTTTTKKKKRRTKEKEGGGMSLTAGLNMPPLTRYQMKTLTAKLKPKTDEMYAICMRLGPLGAEEEPLDARSVLSNFSLAVCAAMKPKKRL